MSSEIFTRVDVKSRPASATSAAAESGTKEQINNSPEVPTTADLPMLPEFRERAQSASRRAALSTAGLAAFIAAVAGIGCGAKAPLRKPSPAISITGSSTTLSASTGRNFGPVGR